MLLPSTNASSSSAEASGEVTRGFSEPTFPAGVWVGLAEVTGAIVGGNCGAPAVAVGSCPGVAGITAGVGMGFRSARCCPLSSLGLSAVVGVLVAGEGRVAGMAEVGVSSLFSDAGTGADGLAAVAPGDGDAGCDSHAANPANSNRTSATDSSNLINDTTLSPNK